MTTAVHLSHASGYLALGMLNEATEELALIAVGDQGLPSVLAARIGLHTAKKEWGTVIGIGEQLATRCPKLEAGWISWAYALRELNRVEEAKAVLLEAEPIHGKSGILHYNLACYYCLLGDAAEGIERLRRACGMDKHWKEAALDDPDLKAIWGDIEAIK